MFAPPSMTVRAPNLTGPPSVVPPVPLSNGCETVTAAPDCGLKIAPPPSTLAAVGAETVPYFAVGCRGPTA